MSNWFKWWKSKFFLTVLGIALATISVSFVLAYFIEWGWILAIIAALLGGLSIRKVLINKLEEIADNN